AIGLIYLAAFVSFGVQALGLVGSHGILPLSEFTGAVRDQFGSERYWWFPMVFWLDHSDFAIQAACWAGAALSLLLIFNVLPRLSLFFLYVLYLSLFYAGQIFMGFQWDLLLLETGFLALLLSMATEPGIWLLRWLLFRLMFLSGAVKLLSGDPTWANLTALEFHYQTQPLPTVFGWYLYHLPPDFQKASAVFMFFVELVIPFLMFAPRRIRFFAAGMTLALQAIIFFTGNYTFFNLLAVALCLSLFDDALLRRFTRPKPVTQHPPSGIFQRAVTAVLFSFVLLASSFQLMETFSLRIPRPAANALSWIAPFGIVNTYGLFAGMTTTRPEIIV